ncbi:hsp90 co-chaperone Cdc37 [Lingula anatina]|uniref:Hsp90 chaperone protein kinase-targeting subunit n=1 Tax=Lingula anatina TaxID=7574 RepID=A0A1S3H6R9_LINAN|nr:hsp90 co-chaperone Cdc37 [Lingula anatina]|eukprot:XP_013381693.1 hsp90 co-chaperone Cdc37 [Lingula anatina]
MSKFKSVTSKGIDYSAWDHIEISDDEDDTHPNIDTPSLFRWRHQARLEKMAELEKEKQTVEKEYQRREQKKAEIQKKLREAEESNAVAEDLSKLKLELSELEKQEAEWKKKEAEIAKKEKETPWNIDTICHDGKSKTVINKSTPAKKEVLTDEERSKRQTEFTKQNEKLLKKFGMFRRYEDSEQFLLEHPFLVCEETANYLVLWCINLEVEEKRDLMNHVSHQTIVMQFILELAKQLDRDPKSCVRPFFSRIKLAEKQSVEAERQYMAAFNDELESFKERVRERAQARIEAAMKEVEMEERQARLGPGGLDPVEVFESLPKALQECFESKDIALLQKTVMEMPKEEAEYHIKRCVDSGLWVPDAKKAEGQEAEGAEAAV